MLDLLNLQEDEVSYGLDGLKILIYGKNTLGKTPQAMAFPKSLLVMGESGGSALKGRKVQIKKKKDFLELVAQLTNEKTLEKMRESYQSIVVDTVEDIIEVFETSLAKEYGVRDVGEIQQLQKGNPNGYSVYRKEFKQQINLLCGCGYTVIFIAHEETIEEPTDETDEKGNVIMKTFIQPKGSKGDKGSARFIRDLCDFRFYIKSNGVDPVSKRTILSTAWCVQTDTFYAGSRFDITPFINPFTAENVIKAIEDAQKKSAENQGSELKLFTKDTTDYKKEDYIEIIKPYLVKLGGLYPNEMAEIIASQLGYKDDGTMYKITEATDDQLTELEVIYGRLVAFACERGIKVDIE